MTAIDTIEIDELYVEVAGIEVMIWEGWFDIDHHGAVTAIRIPSVKPKEVVRVVPPHPLYQPIMTAITKHCAKRISESIWEWESSRAETAGEARYDRQRLED